MSNIEYERLALLSWLSLLHSAFLFLAPLPFGKTPPPSLQRGSIENPTGLSPQGASHEVQPTGGCRAGDRGRERSRPGHGAADPSQRLRDARDRLDQRRRR